MINPAKYAMKQIMKGDFGYDDYVLMIQEIQDDAYNQGIDDCVENVAMKYVQVDYEGVRAGSFYTKTVIDKDSILKLKK